MLLCLILIVGLLPVDAFADDEYTVTIDSGITGGTVTYELYTGDADTVVLTVTPTRTKENYYNYVEGSLKATYIYEGHNYECDIEAGDVEGEYWFFMPAADVTVTAEFEKPTITTPVITVCDQGTTDTQYLPFYGYYSDSNTKSQILYPESLLSGAQGESLCGLRFYCETLSAYTYRATFNVYVESVSGKSFNNEFLSTDSATLVYTGKPTIEDDGGLEIPFDSDFLYTGGDLLITFDCVSPSGYCKAYFYGEAYSGAGIYQRYSGSNIYSVDVLPKMSLLKTKEAAVSGITLANVTGATLSCDETFALEGSTVSLTAAPDEGYVIYAVRMSYQAGSETETVSVNQTDENTYSFTMPGADVTVTAEVLDDHFSGGEGTEESPYLIKDVDDLKLLSYLVNNGEDTSGKFYRLENDIDLSGVS